MLKNNKGYFLTETIIALTVVATIITIMYINSMSYYVKQNIELTKYNTTQGLYSIKEVKKYLSDEQESLKTLANSESSGYIDVITAKNLSDDNFLTELNVESLFFMKYNMGTFSSTAQIAPAIKKEIKTINIEESRCKYRYFAIFNDKSYSTIGVECNVD